LGRESPKNLAKAHENAVLEWAEDAQGGRNGLRKPVSNGMG